MKRYIYILLAILSLVSCVDETKVQNVKLSYNDLQLHVGEQKQLEMFISPLSSVAHNPTSWETSDPNVAVVDEKGNVTAVYTGECTITGKAMHVSDVCRVTVLPIKYDMNFDNAVIYNEGWIKEKGTNKYIIRLHEKSLEFDSVGHSTGDGLFLNLCVFCNDSTSLIPSQYNVKNDSSALSVLPGRIEKINGATYAIGSYLGQYSVNGLNVLFIKEGSLNLSIYDIHNISCHFYGEKQETIKSKYVGVPKYYKTNNESKDNVLLFSSVTEENIVIESEPLYNHSKIVFNCTDTIVEFIARRPKTTDNLPVGKYSISPLVKPFTLLDQNCPIHCNMIVGENSIPILSADVNIIVNHNGNKSYSAYFINANHNSYYLQQKDSKNSISALKIKSN